MASPPGEHGIAPGEGAIVLAVPVHWSTPSFDALPGAVAAPRPAHIVDTIYFDTDDLALARSGARVQWRAGNWTIDIPRIDRASTPVSRTVIDDRRSPTEAPTEVPSGIADIVVSFTRGAALAPAAVERTESRRIDVVALDGTPYAAIVDQTSTVLGGDDATHPYREISITATERAPEGLTDQIAALARDAGAGPIDARPPLLRVFGPRAEAPPDVTVPEVDADSDAIQVIRAAFSTHARRLIGNDPGVRVEAGPESIHRARVAIRRLRADLRTFRPLLDREWADDLRTTLGDMVKPLGTVRDLDVMIGRLELEVDALPKEDHDSGHRIIDIARAEHERAYAELHTAISSPEFVALLSRVIDAALDPYATPKANEDAIDVIPALTRKPWKHLHHHVKELGDDAPDEALHAVRIDAKRVRYAADAAAAIVGKPAKAFAKAIGEVQTVLGEHQDAVTTDRWLREVTDSLAPADRFVAGALAAAQQHSAQVTRAAFTAVWKRASDPALRTWWK